MANLEGTKVGPYEIKALLGAGGMGQVYRARDPRLEREVAIKVLAESLSKEQGYLERFRREARAVARLNHPNVVQVYDFGEQGDLTYLVMPLIQGGTLRDYLAQRQILPLAEAVSIIEQVAGALQYAHERGLVHRDVKPANILMSSEGRALLSDFGIVRLVEKGDSSATLTRFGAFVGSPDYAAPEMVIGGTVDHRVDVYALGVVLFQMLTGRLPFAGATPVSQMMMQAQQPPPSPRSLNPSIPPAVEAVILKALAKKPEERYQTAADFMAALRAASASPATEMRTNVAPLPETEPVRMPPSAFNELPTVMTQGPAPTPGSGPSVYSPAGPGSGPPPVWIGPGSGPAGWPNQGSGPAGWANQGSGPPNWPTPGGGWATPGSGPATPPLPQTYVTGISAPYAPTPAPTPPKPRRSRATSILLVVLAVVLVAGGGATLALAASLGLFKGHTGQTTGHTPTVSAVTPTPTLSPTPTAVAMPSVYYMAHFYVTKNGDLENGDTVGNTIGLSSSSYAQHEGPNGDLYQEGSATQYGWGAGIAQVVSDQNGNPIFVVLVDRLAGYLEADQYFQHQVKLIQSEKTAQSVGNGAYSGVVPDKGQQTFQLIVRDVNIIITIATYPTDTAPQDMSAYFVSITQAIMQRGHACTYSTDGKLNLLPGNNTTTCV